MSFSSLAQYKEGEGDPELCLSGKLGAGGRVKCEVCGHLIALLTLREETGKAGAWGSATGRDSATIIA